jgi:hypothetical protein
MQLSRIYVSFLFYLSLANNCLAWGDDQSISNYACENCSSRRSCYSSLSAVFLGIVQIMRNARSVVIAPTQNTSRIPVCSE